MERSFQSSPDIRARVLAAAAELFATRGYAGTSIAEIRKLSGAPASSIYWEFGSKEGILGVVLEEAAFRWLDQARQSTVSATARHGGFDGNSLAQAFDYLAVELTERPEFLRLLLLLALLERYEMAADVRHSIDRGAAEALFPRFAANA